MLRCFPVDPLLRKPSVVYSLLMARLFKGLVRQGRPSRPDVFNLARFSIIQGTGFRAEAFRRDGACCGQNVGMVVAVVAVLARPVYCHVCRYPVPLGQMPGKLLGKLLSLIWCQFLRQGQFVFTSYGAIFSVFGSLGSVPKLLTVERHAFRQDKLGMLDSAFARVIMRLSCPGIGQTHTGPICGCGWRTSPGTPAHGFYAAMVYCHGKASQSAQQTEGLHKCALRYLIRKYSRAKKKSTGEISCQKNKKLQGCQKINLKIRVYQKIKRKKH
jgi:hypothetical protein